MATESSGDAGGSCQVCHSKGISRCFVTGHFGIFCNFLTELPSALGSGCVISEKRFLASQVLNVVCIPVNQTSKLFPYVVSSIKSGIIISYLSSGVS